MSLELVAKKAARAIAKGKRKGFNSPKMLGILVAMSLVPNDKPKSK